MTRRVSFNAFMNVLHVVLNALSGLATMPILVNHLGAENYGLWTLVVATTGYLGALDLGVPAAAGRLFAAARGDIRAVNAVFSTAFAMLCGIFLAVFVLLLLASWMFFQAFPVPITHQPDVRAALLILGGGVALSIPAAVFESFLWGSERFVLHNAIEITVLLVRTFLIILLVGGDSSLTELALIIAGIGVAGGLTRAFFCWTLQPRIALHWSHCSRQVLEEVSAFATWFTVLSASRNFSPNVPVFVIGNSLGAAAVTTFTIPRILVMYAAAIVSSAMVVIAPRVAILYFNSRIAEQRDLFLAAGRFCLALSYYFAGGYVFFGLPFIQIWQPTMQGHQEYALLLILIAGELLPMTQRSSHGTILYMGKHRRLALYGLAELGVIGVLSLVLVKPYGLIGVCVAAAISNFFFRGLLECIYGCALVGISLSYYARAVFLPLTGAALIALAFFWLLGLSQLNWFELLAHGTLYSVVYWIVLGPWLFLVRRPAA